MFECFRCLKENIYCAKLGFRYRLTLNALLNLSGRAMRESFMRQEKLVTSLTEVAVAVKAAKADAQRMTTLTQYLSRTQALFADDPIFLAINSAWKVTDIDVASCCYFPSMTVPIKLSFRSIDADADLIHVIYKIGDDLRQDQLVMQLIRIMDKMWQLSNLDLKMVTFTIRQTDVRKGKINHIQGSHFLVYLRSNQLGLR